MSRRRRDKGAKLRRIDRLDRTADRGRHVRRELVFDVLFDLAPVGDIFLMLIQCFGERMPSGSVGDKIEVLAPCRIGDRFQRRLAWVANRPRRQALNDIGVIGRGLIEVGPGDAAAERALALRQAVDDFTEAERLMPKSPDPELGLAWVYVYGLKDIDKASDAFQQAAKRGYQLGPREKMYLADGYTTRADLLFWDSRKMRGLPQERDQIQRAANDYKEALDLYQSIVPYPKAAAGVARVQPSLDSVITRLHEIDSGQSQAVPH